MLVKTTGRKIAEKASRLFLQERIRVTHHGKRRVQERISKVEEQLKSSLSDDDYQRIHRMSYNTAEATFQCSEERHLKKLEHLRNGQKNVCLESEYLRDKSRWLVNLSSATLSANEEVLRLSPKFAPSPRKIPYMDIAAGVEAALHYAKLPKEVCEEVTSRALQHTPKPKRNLSNLQQTALRSLKKDNVILKSDKGNATVVMDKDYHQKMSGTTATTYIQMLEGPHS